MMCQMIGMAPISIIGLGRTAVSSLSRVPRPPARITAFIGGQDSGSGSRHPAAAQPLARELPGEREHERRVIGEVARQKPARLLRDPVDPLEPPLLHPRRRL